MTGSSSSTDNLFDYSDSEYEDDAVSTTNTPGTMIRHRSHLAPNINGMRRENAMYFHPASMYECQTTETCNSFMFQNAPRPQSMPVFPTTMQQTSTPTTTWSTLWGQSPERSVEATHGIHEEAQDLARCCASPMQAADLALRSRGSPVRNYRRRNVVNSTAASPKDCFDTDSIPSSRSLDGEDPVPTSTDQTPKIASDIEGPKREKDSSDTLQGPDKSAQDQHDPKLDTMTGETLVTTPLSQAKLKSESAGGNEANSQKENGAQNEPASEYRPLPPPNEGSSTTIGLGIIVPDMGQNGTTHGSPRKQEQDVVESKTLQREPGMPNGTATSKEAFESKTTARHRRTMPGFNSGEYITRLEPDQPPEMPTLTQPGQPGQPIKTKKRRIRKLFGCFMG